MAEQPQAETNPRQPVSQTACPDRETLAQLLSETWADQRVCQHVESCQRCQRLLDQLSDSGVLDEIRPWVCKPSQDLPALEPAQSPSELGRLGDLAIDSVLGRGGMGIVFRGRDLRLGREVAVKFVRPGSSPEVERRFAREARAVAALRHENIVPIYHIGQNKQGQDYLVLPLIHGQTLKARLQTSELAPKHTAEIIRQIADALAAAHAAGLVHRDVKPANILLDEVDRQAKIMDFGLVRVVEENTLTQADMLCGTPEYMSPEQATLGDKTDRRCDIYSLGVTLYECLTGTPPYRGRPLEVIDQHRIAAPVAPHRLNRLVPADLETICLKAMCKEPAYRFQTMEDLRDDLRRFLDGKPILARPVSLLQRIRLWVRRESRLAAALGTVVASLVLGSAVSWQYWSRSLEQSRLAASRFDASLQTINTLADLTTQFLSGDPGLASIRKQVQTMADKAFEPLVEMRPSDAANLVRYLQAMDSLGTIKHTVASPVEALVFRQKIRDDNRDLVEQYRESDSLRREWASLHHRLAVCHIEMRDFPKAASTLDEAAELLFETDIQDQLLIARIKHSRGTIHKWVNNDNARAAPEFRQAVEKATLYAAAIPEGKLALATANNSQGWLADCEMQLGNLDLAEKLLRELYDNYSVLANVPDATYLSRLDKGRAAFTLMNLLVTRGNGNQAIQWSVQAGPDIRSLQTSNPSLMEPSALSIGFDCHVVAAELLQGDFEVAMERIQQALAEAAALELRFPNTTRTWQVHGHAKLMWFTAAAHVADYGAMIAFLENWIRQVDEEIKLQKNIGFNQQLRMSLLMNLAIALDRKEELSRSAEVWEQVLSVTPESQRPACQLLSQVAPYRASLQQGKKPELVLDTGLEDSLASVVALQNQGIPYLTAQYSLAEVYAVAVNVLRRRWEQRESVPEGSSIAASDASSERIQQYRQAVVSRLRGAGTAGYFRVGDRFNNFRNDPLFADDEFQAVVAE